MHSNKEISIFVEKEGGGGGNGMKKFWAEGKNENFAGLGMFSW